MHSTSLWCVPVRNSALADLLERLPRYTGPSRTPCSDVLPRILAGLKTPEGSAANTARFRTCGLHNEIKCHMQVHECGGRTCPHLETAKIRSKLRIVKKEVCHEARKRQPIPRVARLHPGGHEGKPDGQGRLSSGGWANLRQGLSGLACRHFVSSSVN